MACDLALRLMGGVRPISPVVRLPFGCGHFDQSQERRDGPISDINDEPTID
jgi:hypothetical protein